VISEARVSALRARMAAEQVPALAVTDPANVTYLTGFDGVFDEEPAHIALVTERATTLYTDNRYAEASSAASEGTGWEVRAAWPDLVSAACADLARDCIGRLALEDTASRRYFDSVESAFEGEVVAARGWVESLRAVKESAEVERIVHAQALTDAAFEHVLGTIRPGLTEREVALELEFHMRRHGSDGVAFPPIVASGPNSALPHARVTDRVIGHGELLKMDFGARVEGYCADMTRTVVVGKASERQREIYEAVRSANAAGIGAVRGGAKGREIDAAARSVLSDAGLGELFTHGLGHGVGLQVHELPNAGPRSEDVVSTGSVITIEPGVYVAGFGGVRIEDLVVVEEAGARVLTRSPKDLIEI